jgi:5-methyltetrahydrofolate--homocysteine methyltransferase
MDLYDKPGEVLRLVHEIKDAWFQFYDRIYEIVRHTGRGTTPWAPIWSPDRTYMLQSDFSFMISPKMFEQFVMPDLTESCNKLDHAFYHLDGTGELPHLDMMLSIERLRGIQWIPGAGQPPPEEWLPVLQQIRRNGKLCQLYVTTAGALSIVREIGGRGFVFCIEEYMSAQDAADFLKALSAADIGRLSWPSQFPMPQRAPYHND